MRISLLAISLLPVLRAHDMWIEPGTFFPQPGQIVAVRLRVGENLVGDPIPRDPRLIREFFVSNTAGQRVAAVGKSGADPAGLFRASESGSPMVVGYHSNPSHAELPAEKFNDYLRQEGLESVLALRAARKQSDAPAREQFTRCAKALLGAGAPDRELGFPLELVAERPPSDWKPGQMLPVRLTHQGKPLQGALVVAIHKLHAARKMSVRSDRNGRVQFQMPAAMEPGMWMIKAVHMIPGIEGAEWTSYWASLTFETAGSRK
jgi:uncharacterized GH25 family protein